MWQLMASLPLLRGVGLRDSAEMADPLPALNSIFIPAAYPSTLAAIFISLMVVIIASAKLRLLRLAFLPKRN
jgi:hypothetical protein